MDGEALSATVRWYNENFEICDGNPVCSTIRQFGVDRAGDFVVTG